MLGYIFSGFMAVILLAVIFAPIIIWGARKYLVTLHQEAERKWSDARAGYQRRFDLVPNLVAAVDNFTARQEKFQTGVIAMRRERVVGLKDDLDKALADQDAAKLGMLAEKLTQATGSLVNALTEAYPDFKGEALYSNLNRALETTEDNVAVARRNFNTAVIYYNTYRQRGFPALIAGSIFGFKYERTYFESDPEADKAPSVRQAFQDK